MKSIVTMTRTAKSGILLLAALFLCVFSARSQNATSSPYSRYGIGDLQFQGGARHLGMGGVSIGVPLNLQLNFQNPAAYSNLFLTTFELGANANLMEINSDDARQEQHTVSFSYFALGVPLKSKRWGLGFGLMPYSNIGYSVKDPQTNVLGEVETRTYQGSGGLNNFFISTGVRPFKNTPLSIGANVSYLFGVLGQDRRIEFDNPVNFNTRLLENTSLGWFTYNLGVQYTIDSLRLSPSDSLLEFDKLIRPLEDSLVHLDDVARKASDSLQAGYAERREFLKNRIRQLRQERGDVKRRRERGDWSLTFGATYSPSAELHARQTYTATSFKYFDNSSRDQIVVRDTIAYVEGAEGRVKLPVGLGFGASIRQGTRWLAGADFQTQNWNTYRYFGASDSLADSWRVSVGGQFTPNDRVLKNRYKTVQYRAGFHYARTFLQLRGNQLNEMGVSIGLGIPIRRASTFIQFAAEAGERGTVESDLLKERYLRFTLGFTISDRWFLKPKYD